MRSRRMSSRTLVWTWAVVAWAAAWSVLVGGTCTIGIKYVYDENSRLLAVVDDTSQASSNAAVYHYDAAGNVTSIERINGTTVRILTVTPSCGLPGSTININGIGLSSGDANTTTTVAFNGTTATITSQDDTRLIVTVPSGATSGTIQVTVGTTTANSPASFTIGCGGPVITDLQPVPRTYAVGDTISIIGSGFAASATDERVSFNGRLGDVTTPGVSTMSAKIPPNATSGRVRVSTRTGTAVSPVDYFIAPPGYTWPEVDLGSPSHITPTATATVTITAANNVGMVLFDGVGGARVSLLVDIPSKTISGWPIINIYGPGGVQLPIVQSFWWVDAVTLPETGTYSIVFGPATSSGSLTFTLYDVPPDFSSPISFGGSGVTITTTTPGQNAQLTFSGTAGHRVSVVQQAGGSIGQWLSTQIQAPDLSVLTLSMPGFGFRGITTLPSTGTYALLIDPSGTNAGTANFLIYDVPADFSQSITLGTQVNLPFTAPGQRAFLTFSETAGHRVSVVASGDSPSVTLLAPDQSTIRGGTTWIPPQTLPTTGTYTLVVSGTDMTYGTVAAVSVTAYDVVDVTGTIQANGTPVSVSTTVPGQKINLSFSGNTGQRVSAQATNNTSPSWVNLNILNPDGTLLAQGASTDHIDPATLIATGTHTLQVDPWARPDVPFSITLKLFTVAADISGSLLINGAAFPVTITTPGQNALLTFPGNLNQTITMHITSNTFTGGVSPLIQLLRADGTTVVQSGSVGATSFNFSSQVLPATETYQIKVDPTMSPQGPNTGSMNVSVTSP